jgi:hypothetical protein
MVCTTTFLSSYCSKDILQLDLWWKMEYCGLYFGLTIDWGLVLFSKGLRYLCDIYDPRRYDFFGWEEARTKFSLVEVYYKLLG